MNSRQEVQNRAMTFGRKRRFLEAACIIAGIVGASTAKAQTAGCYTLASLQGSYAIVNSYAGNVASGLQVESFDGRGNLASTGIVNQLTAGSTTGQRTIVNVATTGTYTINCDGTGTFNRIVTRPDGSTVSTSNDFLVTQASVQDGRLVATTIQDAQRQPSVILPGGVFAMQTHSLRPNTGCFTVQSLQGSYGVVLNYGADLGLGLQSELLDGKGNLTRSGIINEPTVGSATGERTVTTVTSTGTYTVNCNGTGTFTRLVTLADGSTAPGADDFVITAAAVQNGQLVATSIADVQRDPSVVIPGGVFVTRVHTLRPALASPVVVPPTGAVTTAIANPKGAATTNSQIQLDGSLSTSADGKPLAFSWTQPASSPAATIFGANTATPLVQFTGGLGTYTFVLTVTDSAGKTATDSTSVTVQYRARG